MEAGRGDHRGREGAEPVAELHHVAGLRGLDCRLCVAGMEIVKNTIVFVKAKMSISCAGFKDSGAMS